MPTLNVPSRRRLAMRNPDASPTDAFSKSSGKVFMSGIQALVRLPLIQAARDRQDRLNTGGYVSGYRGSPLGGYDLALKSARAYLDTAGIVVRTAVNEELAATAVWGTQQLHLSPGARKDGVFALWYGKGPGVDRSGDVFKHGNAAGSSRYGGVLCLAGDDHAAKSSSVPHQSDHAFMSALMPVLYPSSPHEFVRMGLLGFAMSRYSGCWVGMKVISDTVESSVTTSLDGEIVDFVEPKDFVVPAGGLNLRWPDDRHSQDHRLQNYKGYAAIAFGHANGVNRIVLRGPCARLGIVASGKAFEEVCESLALLQIDSSLAKRLGISLLKIGMPWPLDPIIVRDFSRGLEELFIVEERREMVENQVKQHLFNWHSDTRPRVVGKFDENDAPCLPLDHELSADLIADALAERLLRLEMPGDIRGRLETQIAFLRAARKSHERYAPLTTRLPHFCAGCPHNTSTVVPEGSRALAGIGCHFMTMWMDRRTETFTPMGCEGVTWVGTAPFTNEKHIFANLGDGTYFHSGILAIRQALAADVNITYKILFNDAVAMTGGQAIDGTLTVPQLTHQLRDEGVRTIYLLSDNPKAFAQAELAPGVVIGRRDQLDGVMRSLRETPGCSVLIYHQICATELRRKRTRGLAPKPARLAYIEPSVCEGCGDCSAQSNCIAIEPLETELGRKRQINQSACNSDLSCVRGFCPSFVTVRDARLAQSRAITLPNDPIPDPTAPALSDGRRYNISITGVGGTGILTLGHLIGMAAHLDGLSAQVLDITGLAQKGGAVISHVRLGSASTLPAAPYIPIASADLLLAADAIVAASPESMKLLDSQRTTAVIDRHLNPTSDFVRQRDFDFRFSDTISRLKSGVQVARTELDFHALAMHALGDAIFANPMLLGFAYQSGLIPLSAGSLERAIRLNRKAVENNLAAFAWGRWLVVDPTLAQRLGQKNNARRALADMTTDEIVAHRKSHLTEYQGVALATAYVDWVGKFKELERARTGKDDLTRAVAIHLATVLAPKDEYEVARLFSSPQFRRDIAQTFEGRPSLSFHLSPPLLAKLDKDTGRPAKLTFGSWVLPLFGILAAVRKVRGTWADPFAWSHERRLERRLKGQYLHALDRVMTKLSPNNHTAAVNLASAPGMIRGYGPVKEAAFAKFDQNWPRLMREFEKA
ncbi:MAG: indolepyruvate ferredoxin oxidoreductase family protein [Rhodospirillaceae bacterium]|nr:indolepyruvate ferredoxin oxidoreductase family protein [Rhodospirillaceae bacterium]